MLLTNHLAKYFGTPFAGEHLITHISMRLVKKLKSELYAIKREHVVSTYTCRKNKLILKIEKYT